jgi:hypothetical protein
MEWLFFLFGWLMSEEEPTCEEPLEDENGEWVVCDEY